MGILVSFKCNVGILLSFKCNVGILLSFKCNVGILVSFKCNVGILVSFKCNVGILVSFDRNCNLAKVTSTNSWFICLSQMCVWGRGLFRSPAKHCNSYYIYVVCWFKESLPCKMYREIVPRANSIFSRLLHFGGPL